MAIIYLKMSVESNTKMSCISNIPQPMNNWQRKMFIQGRSTEDYKAKFISNREITLSQMRKNYSPRWH